ncbi:iron chelate uptake ABC transporter family permease subunit [Herbiconiux sp. L3-i23]|uniref:FecCD family ABC transporter permease n=1 Tax=Herbiconiux sp. L3-i23 TaxID=2905871 RepID=UPI00204B6BF5|nr:iron chelate uptake ABC transporter family permease subunit [Herbiconiux sp. L3-i23]BDI22258.1 ABC transporter permease [Herbiconiux sp. L3-i23]
MTTERLHPGSIVIGRRRRATRSTVVTLVLALLVVALFLTTLVVGERFYSLGDVFAVITGQDVPGASFTVGRLRLPRAIVGLLVGAAFGIAGMMFQGMLRNPLASPDIIGISYGSSAAAVTAIAFFDLGGAAVSPVAIVGGLVVALLIYGLSWRGGVHGSRLILVGIAVGAVLLAVIQLVLTRTEVYKAAEALRWITGSLNSAFWGDVLPLVIAMALLLPAAFALSRQLSILQLGDDLAAGLGVRPERARLLIVLVGVGLTSVATAVAGPIAFVAFLAGPISTRLLPGAPRMLPAALVGSALVLGADLVGANLLPTTFPVGVVTGAVGAPYLLWLIARSNRNGGRL